MTHRLQQRHPLSAIGHNPDDRDLCGIVANAANEVLSIAVALDMNVSEEQFLWTMRQMWRDVKFEVEQHINPLERQRA